MCDASQPVHGAALLQDGRHVAFLSRALSETEARYPQIERGRLVSPMYF